ncbi:MAG: hypothetical protein ACRDUV_15465 [Pseudonocardiaceae bacterium]
MTSCARRSTQQPLGSACQVAAPASRGGIIKQPPVVVDARGRGRELGLPLRRGVGPVDVEPRACRSGDLAPGRDERRAQMGVFDSPAMRVEAGVEAPTSSTRIARRRSSAVSSMTASSALSCPAVAPKRLANALVTVLLPTAGGPTTATNPAAEGTPCSTLIPVSFWAVGQEFWKLPDAGD